MSEIREVLKRILASAKISRSASAAALGLSTEVLDEMLEGKRPIPESLVPLIAAVVGVPETTLTSFATGARQAELPAIWYKLRSEFITHADREYVLAFRQLAFYQHELEEVTDSRSISWKVLFEDI